MADPIKQAEIWEDGLRTDPSKRSFEWWYFDANLDDGSTIVVTFFTKAPSNASGSPQPRIQIRVTKPDGKKLAFDQIFRLDQFHADTKKCDVKMGENSVSGDLKKYKIQLHMSGISGELEFERIAPSYSTSSKGHTKPEYFGWFCAIPYGKVKGKITYENTEHHLKGTGYHDHNWGSINIKQVCEYWYWGRGNAGDYSMIFTVMVLPKILGGKHVSMMYLAKGDKELIADSNHLELTYTDLIPPTPKDGHLPKKLTFAYSDDMSVEFSLTDPILIETADPLGDEPELVKFITRLFSKPLYVRYNAQLEMKVGSLGKTETKKGKGLYEIMILQ